jgi:hypothetical protein
MEQSCRVSFDGILVTPHYHGHAIRLDVNLLFSFNEIS